MVHLQCFGFAGNIYLCIVCETGSRVSRHFYHRCVYFYFYFFNGVFPMKFWHATHGRQNRQKYQWTRFAGYEEDICHRQVGYGWHSFMITVEWLMHDCANQQINKPCANGDWLLSTINRIYLFRFIFCMIFPSIYHHFWITACRWPCTAHAHTKSKQVAIVGFSPRPLTANSFIHRCHKLRGDQIHNGI